MLIKPYGEAALIVEFEQKISPEINQQVQSLLHAVKDQELAITQAIPAYCSLTITFDPKVTHFKKLKAQIEAIKLSSKINEATPRTWQIPACYDLGIDYDELEKELSLSKK